MTVIPVPIMPDRVRTGQRRPGLGRYHHAGIVRCTSCQMPGSRVSSAGGLGGDSGSRLPGLAGTGRCRKLFGCTSCAARTREAAIATRRTGGPCPSRQPATTSAMRARQVAASAASSAGTDPRRFEPSCSGGTRGRLGAILPLSATILTPPPPSHAAQCRPQRPAFARRRVCPYPW
jgi:hypothetical protein